ncbi:MAG: NAD-dependent DNA ligase LigA [Candidatus Kerfeldbacteria bacterium]|nr:NAD-dependent DNA ligase LigA [Candidatus Kerfeldbacteria bacterium]
MPSINQQIRERAARLRKEIEHHRYLYHVLNRQEISEAALDSLKHEIKKLEDEHPEIITPDSPTQRVAGQPLPELKTVRHGQRMLSLEDAFSPAELQAWEKRWQKLAPHVKTSYLVDLKLDGLAISIVYSKGLLTGGSTRGDGVTGEDVTHNVRTIESLPIRLRLDDLAAGERRQVVTGDVEIRGEVVMPKRVFQELNDHQKKAERPVFANPRNVAAGSIRQLDPKLAAGRKLDFFAWELVTDLGQPTLKASYDLIRKLGVKVNPRAVVCDGVKEVAALHQRIGKQRDDLPFQIDGLVVKVNDRQLYQRLGVVGKAPRAAVAYKFAAEQATTVVEGIKVQVGRTGALTPVALFRPVQVAGTTVSRATLHNADEIARLDVRIGDTVVIAKAGDIIPDVVQVLKNLRPRHTKPFHMPRHCPVCQQPAVRRQGEAIHFCVNHRCPARRREGLYHFASKKALDIDGLGPSTIDALVDEGIVREPADFFHLRADQLQELPLFAEKKAANLITAIAKSHQVPLDRFLFGLGIRHVGEQTAIDLGQHFRSVDALIKATAEEIADVPNIGSIVGESIVGFFQDPKNRKQVSRLRQILTIVPPQRPQSAKLKRKVVVVTGTLDQLSREEAHARIRAAGGTVGTSVTKKTTYLVAGENPGLKLEVAKKLGVQTIDEKTFLRMVE